MLAQVSGNDRITIAINDINGSWREASLRDELRHLEGRKWRYLGRL